MNEKIIKAIFRHTSLLMGMFILLGLSLSSCQKELEVDNTFPFEVTMMPYPKRIKQGETVEIRCRLTTRGDYEGASFSLRHFIYEGAGALTLGTDRNTVLAPNDRYPIPKGDFRIYYTSRSAEAHQIELVFEDNLGQKQEMTLNFASASTTNTQRTN